MTDKGAPDSGAPLLYVGFICLGKNGTVRGCTVPWYCILIFYRVNQSIVSTAS